MIICICNNINDKQIKSVLENVSVLSIEELQENIKICDQCKMCSCEIESILFEQEVNA